MLLYLLGDETYRLHVKGAQASTQAHLSQASN